jgi:hypothetical protein
VLSVLEKLTPHARVATAVLPFVVAIVLRIVLGRSLFTRMLISISTMWFVANVLMAPYSTGMRQDIHQLEYYFR